MEKVLLVSPNFGDLAQPNFDVKQFPDDESYVRIPQIEELRGKNVVLLHRLYPEQNTRLLQLFQTLKALEPVAAHVTAVVPYLPYARQDEVSKPGEVAAAQMVCGMLARAGLDKLITFDCHFAKGLGEMEFGGLKIENRSMAPELLGYLKPRIKEPLLVSTGGGTAYMIKDDGGFSVKKVHGDYISDDTSFRRSATQKIEFAVAGKNVIIIDDIIAGGSTMAEAARACKAGGAKSIICTAVHGLLVGNAFDRIRAAGAKHVVVTDSVPGPAAIISIASGLKDILPSTKELPR